MPEEVFFVYDGECPLCQAGAKYVRIREAAGVLHLVDARTQRDHPVMQEIRRRGLDVDAGMVVKMGDVFYHGADALQVLALLSTESGRLNRLNALLFRHKIAACLGYPFLRAGRRLALMAKGVAPLPR